MPCDILRCSEDDARTYPLPNTIAQMARALSLAVEELKYLFCPLFSVLGSWNKPQTWESMSRLSAAFLEVTSWFWGFLEAFRSLRKSGIANSHPICVILEEFWPKPSRQPLEEPGFSSLDWKPVHPIPQTDVLWKCRPFHSGNPAVLGAAGELELERSLLPHPLSLRSEMRKACRGQVGILPPILEDCVEGEPVVFRG